MNTESPIKLADDLGVYEDDAYALSDWPTSTSRPAPPPAAPPEPPTASGPVPVGPRGPLAPAGAVALAV